MEKNKFLCSEQNGFRQNKTINMAVYDFLHTVMLKVDERIPICAVLCDMTQAFNYVDHNILIKKLDAYGVRGNVLKLIESYLTNRRQITAISRINRTKQAITYLSQERVVKFGVPQGSVLGPLLFIIYINDFPKSIEHPMTLFADDSTITIACKHTDTYELDINNALASVICWLDNNNLKINLNKTQILHFNQRIPVKNDIKLKYKNNIICRVSNAKFLGLTIDQKLDWKDHIETISKKVSSSSYALYKLAPIVNIDTLLTAYHGLVASILRYGIIFWGNSTHKDVLFRMQKRCIRAMFGLKNIDSCKPYFVKHQILSLPSLYILETVLFVKKNPQLFPKCSDGSERSQRDNRILRLHRSKTALMSKSVFCMAPKLYNKVPKAYKDLNINSFNKSMKKLLINKCYYSVDDYLNDVL